MSPAFFAEEYCRPRSPGADAKRLEEGEQPASRRGMSADLAVAQVFIESTLPAVSTFSLLPVLLIALVTVVGGWLNGVEMRGCCASGRAPAEGHW